MQSQQQQKKDPSLLRYKLNGEEVAIDFNNLPPDIQKMIVADITKNYLLEMFVKIIMNDYITEHTNPKYKSKIAHLRHYSITEDEELYMTEDTLFESYSKLPLKTIKELIQEVLTTCEHAETSITFIYGYVLGSHRKFFAESNTGTDIDGLASKVLTDIMKVFKFNISNFN